MLRNSFLIRNRRCIYNLTFLTLCFTKDDLNIIGIKNNPLGVCIRFAFSYIFWDFATNIVDSILYDTDIHVILPISMLCSSIFNANDLVNNLRQ